MASALAVVCPRGAVWCRASARAIATLIRAYFRYAQRRRSLHRRAALVAWSTRVSPTEATLAKMSHSGKSQLFDVRWLVLLLLWLFLRRVNEEVMHIATQLHVFIRHATETWCRVTWESDSRRLRHHLEPSSTHSCERSKARKTGAQLRDNRRSAKNDAKCVKKPLHCCNTPSRVPFTAAQLNVHQLWR